MRRANSVIILDLSTVWYEDLSVELLRLQSSRNISGSAFTWFDSYLHRMTQTVCFSGETAPLTSVAHGVLQGSGRFQTQQLLDRQGRLVAAFTQLSCFCELDSSKGPSLRFNFRACNVTHVVSVNYT